MVFYVMINHLCFSTEKRRVSSEICLRLAPVVHLVLLHNYKHLKIIYVACIASETSEIYPIKTIVHVYGLHPDNGSIQRLCDMCHRGNVPRFSCIVPCGQVFQIDHCTNPRTKN